MSENETGLFHNPGDIIGIENAILKLVEDKNLRLKMGAKGRERTKNLFEKSYVVSEFMRYLNNIIELHLRKNCNNFINRNIYKGIFTTTD